MTQSDGHAVYTPEEMGLADRRSAVPMATLMAHAGLAIARLVRRRYAPCRTLVLVGPGNNGGDGLVAARLLQDSGWPVLVAAWRGPVRTACPAVPFRPAEAARAGLVIDAVFGAGLNRAVPDDVAEVLAAAGRIVAVDVPSGLAGATGVPLGRVAPAEATISFVRKKPAHLLLPGRGLCGEVLIADIGMPAEALPAPALWENGPWLWSLPRAGAADHKYTRGHVTILGGTEMTGAARLAAGAARRAGGGLVTIAALGRADVYRAGDPGLLVSEAPVARLLEDRRRTVWLAGPGLGDAIVPPALLREGRKLVLDADALRGTPESLRGAAVLTPHAGEFVRVFGAPGPDRLAAVRAAAALTGAVVLLKGADTIIAAPDGRAAINANAPPFLATAGAGDVLAGIIAGLIAQGMADWEAACAGAWLHGRAAQLAGPGMIAEDLSMMLSQALASG